MAPGDRRRDAALPGLVLGVLADTPFVQGQTFLLYALSALIWLAVFGVWAVKFLPVFWRPGQDGR